MSAILDKLLTLLAPRRREYLIIDQEFIILETSLRAECFADCPQEIVTGNDIRLGFPELIGIEDTFTSIFQGKEEHFELKGLGRFPPQHSLLYFNLYVVKNLFKEGIENNLIILLEDVTEQMVLEQNLVQASNENSLLVSKLLASKAYIDQIITSMADALLVTTQSGIIKTANPTAQILFGYSEEELIGSSLAKIISDEFFLANNNHPSTPDNFLHHAEVVCQTKLGKKLTVAFSYSAIHTEFEELKNFIYIGRDITERQRTQKRLAVQHATTRIMSEAANLDEASPKLLQAICENLDWDIGELWIPTESLVISLNSKANTPISTTLRCTQMWVKPSITALEFLESSRKTTFTFGVGLPGHIWASRFSYWIPDVVDDTNFVRLKLAAAAGLHGAFGFPIQSDGEVLGVMIFFSRDKLQPDQYLLEVMGGIGNQLGQFIKRKQAEAALLDQREQTEHLLANILPSPIVARLKKQPGTIAEDFADVTVMFADIVGFTEISTLTSPTELVELLNTIFSKFDQLAEVHGLEKIKTIGDAYMVVGGVPKPQCNHAQAIAEMALDVQQAIANFHSESGKPLSLRIGINTGPVVAGIIGIKKFSYDLWGDVVNIASRMESQGLPGQIQVTASTYERLKNQYLLEKRGIIQVKGKGEMTTYLLVGRKEL